MRIFSRFSPRQIIPNRCERFGHQRVVNVIHSILLLCPSKASYMMKGISAPLINASTSARTTFAGTSPTKAVCTWRCESIKATCGRPSTPSFRAQKSFWRFLGSVEPTQGLLKALAFQHQWFSSIDIYIYIFCARTSSIKKVWKEWKTLWELGEVTLRPIIFCSSLGLRRRHPLSQTRCPSRLAAWALIELVPSVGNLDTNLQRSRQPPVFRTSRPRQYDYNNKIQ